MFLTPQELYELTHRKRPDAQAKELNHLGIPFKRRGDGTVAVLKEAVDKEFGLVEPSARKRIEPNWNAANAR